MSRRPGSLRKNSRGLRAGAGALRQAPHRAFTLLELLLAVSLTTLIMAGLGSAVVLAIRAVPSTEGGASASLTAARAIETFIDEIGAAISVSYRADSEIEVTIGDRTGDTIADTVRYRWSGTPGDPLERRWNGGTWYTACDDVHAFSLSYMVRPVADAPRVLLMVPDETALVTQDTTRRSLMEGWGFTVTPVTASTPPATLAALLAEADVVYISESALPTDVGTKLTGATIGVVNEERYLYDELGVCESSGVNGGTAISLVDVSHPITAGHAAGSLAIFKSYVGDMLTGWGTIASGVQRLAESTSGKKINLFVADAGATLLDDTPAAGRRVMLPWGQNGIDLALLTADGLEIMKRSIEWAAEREELVAVRVSLQVGDDDADRMETHVLVPAIPEAPP